MNNDITKQLVSMADEKYKSFHSRLMPTIPADRVLGVSVPKTRALAQRLYREGGWREYLKCLPHFYYEENNLHGFIIEKIESYPLCIEYLEEFLPFIDNWATCDSLNPKVFYKNKEFLKNQIYLWLESSHVYTVRFAICMLIKHFSGDELLDGVTHRLANFSTDEYYIRMAIAWYLSVIFINHPDTVMFYLENNLLEVNVHNMTIGKIRDSRRVSKVDKERVKEFIIHKG